MYIIIEVVIMINKDNSFATNFKPNLDNAQIALEYLKQHNERFKYNYLNHTIYKLWDLINEPQARAWLEPPAPNKTYPDLLERYIHISEQDPCSYKREIRDILLSDTPTVELDVHAESVYIFAKYISHDDLLLDTYIKHDDFYSIIPGKSRDEQKMLVQVWLQGPYNESIIYNAMFPVTAQYLKETSNNYKRNSGLFRDIETVKLIEILKSCGKKALGHLHDGIYVSPRGIKAGSDAIYAQYDNGIRFKVKRYKDKKYIKSESDIINDISSIDWKHAQNEHKNDYNKCALTSFDEYQFNKYKDECYATRIYTQTKAVIGSKMEQFTPAVNNALMAYLITNDRI